MLFILQFFIVLIGVAILAYQFSNRRKGTNFLAAVVGSPTKGSIENKKKHDIWDIESGSSSSPQLHHSHNDEESNSENFHNTTNINNHYNSSTSSSSYGYNYSNQFSTS